MPEPSPKPQIVPCQLTDGAELPYRASLHSAGWDLRCSRDVVIFPGETALIPTGIRMALPEGCEAQIRPRSGLSLKTHLRIVNSPGTIDADYRDEIAILVQNVFSSADLAAYLLRKPQFLDVFAKTEKIRYYDYFQRIHGAELAGRLPEELAEQVLWLDEDGLPLGSLKFAKSERIAQMIISRYASLQFASCDDLSRFGSDRGGGFGHSGLA